MSTHKLCFGNMKNIRMFLSESFHFSVIKFSVYLNWHVFVMIVQSAIHLTADSGLQVQIPAPPHNFLGD